MEQPSGERWSGSHFVVREKRLTLGRQYYVLGPDDQPLAFCRQKMFKLREDIRFYADETQKEELFRLSARKVLDFNANLDVIDSSNGAAIGSLRRKGWHSLIRDKWEVCDPQGSVVAVLDEDHIALALVRRFGDLIPVVGELAAAMIPYGYHLTAPGGRMLAGIRERFQLFGDTYDLRVEEPGTIDPRVLVGLTVCVDALEGE